MKKIVRRTMFMVLLLGALLLSAVALGEISGKCGENLTYTLDDNGLLIINGRGSLDSAPWQTDELRDKIVEVEMYQVDSIGKGVFANCTNLVGVSASGAKNIGEGAFYKCTALSRTTFDEVNHNGSIGDYAFYGCTSLTGLGFSTYMDDYTIEFIGKSAYEGCTSLKDFIPECTIKKIGERAFANCTGIESITIPKGLTELEEAVFYNCSGIDTDVTIPDSVTKMGEYAFAKCSNIPHIYLPDNLTDFPGNALTNSAKVRHATVGSPAAKALSKLGYSFYDSNETSCLLNYRFSGDTTTDLELVKIAKSEAFIHIPAGVTVIEDGACYQNPDILTISFPDTVTNIGENAFAECPRLFDLGEFPKTCKPLGKQLFTNAPKFIFVVFSGNVGTIGEGAFYECTALEEIIFKGSVSTIEKAAFGKCTNLMTLALPEGISTIAEISFAGCESLETISLPKSVTKIEKQAFADDRALQTVNYAGTKADREKIEIADGNTALLNATWICQDGIYEPTNPTTIVTPTPTPTATQPQIPTPTPTQSQNPTATPTPTPTPTVRPAGQVMSYSEFIAAPEQATVTVETYVQATQAWENNRITAYAQDQNGAYFLYNMECTKKDAEKLIPGTKIRVTGKKAQFAGEIEIVDGVFTILPGEQYLAGATDVTALLGTDRLIQHMNQKVSFSEMTVEACDASGKAFAYQDEKGKTGDLYFKASRNKQTFDFVVESSLSGKGTAVYKAAQALTVGDVINLEGFLYWYYGMNPHITSITSAAESQSDIPMNEVVLDGVRYVLNHTQKTATVTGVTNKKMTDITILSTLTVSKKTYKVTAIGKNAFKGLTKLSAVTIGKNVKTIGDKAFYGCKKLKKITVRGTSLKKVGKEAFKKIAGKAVFTCPKKKLTSYKKLFKEAGAPSGATFQK